MTEETPEEALPVDPDFFIRTSDISLSYRDLAENVLTDLGKEAGQQWLADHRSMSIDSLEWEWVAEKKRRRCAAEHCQAELSPGHANIMHRESGKYDYYCDYCWPHVWEGSAGYSVASQEVGVQAVRERGWSAVGGSE